MTLNDRDVQRKFNICHNVKMNELTFDFLFSQKTVSYIKEEGNEEDQQLY